MKILIIMLILVSNQLLAATLNEANQFFNFVQDKYPKFLTPFERYGKTFELTYLEKNYHVRRYREDLYVGVTDQDVYLYSTKFSGLVYYGKISDFVPQTTILTVGENGTFKGCSGLQTAFNFAQRNYEIRIEQGNYPCIGLEIPSKNNSNNNGRIHISGGWDSSFLTRNDAAYYKSTSEISDQTFANKTVLDGNNQGQILKIESGYVTLTGIVFKGGRGTNGGAIEGSVDIIHCLFIENHASEDGGAVRGSSRIYWSTFSKNSAGDKGGAASAGGGSSFYNNVFHVNKAKSGGAIALRDGGDRLSGGDVFDTIFLGNQADFGGAIQNEGGDLSIINSRFFGNSAGRSGGAISVSKIFIHDVADSKIINSLFVRNKSNLSGGALTIQNARIVNSTFVDNSTTSGIGGAFRGDGEIYNSIFLTILLKVLRMI